MAPGHSVLDHRHRGGAFRRLGLTVTDREADANLLAWQRLHCGWESSSVDSTALPRTRDLGRGSAATRGQPRTGPGHVRRLAHSALTLWLVRWAMRAWLASQPSGQ